MCMLRITTYDECWAQYTHVLICSVESHDNNRQDSPGGCVDFLKCPNLKSEHIHIKHPKCVCKTYPPEGVEPVHCARMWGGSFVGDVNCSMLPGSAVRFEFRDREWQNCINVERLRREGLRFLPDDYKPPVTAQVWHDSEWDGDGKLVNWRDTDWVTLSQKGLSMWQRQQSQASRDHGTAIQDRSGLDDESQTYDNVRLVTSDISSTQKILRRSKGQLLLPVANMPESYFADKINDLIVDWKKQRKDHSEVVTYDRYMAPPSIGQPRFQRELSIITNNLLTTDQARQRGQLELFEEANAREKSNAERKAQWNGPYPSTFAVPTLPPVPTGLKIVPFWEAARTLQERREEERIESGGPLNNGMQSLTGPVSSTVIRARDDSRILQCANQTVNVGAQVSASREVSSASAYGSESSQNHGWREKDKNRSNLLQNTSRQRLAFRDKRLKDETQAAGQPVQADTQHSYMHSSVQRNKGTLVNGLPFPLWNGVPESVVSYAYNNTLPESDDRNFIFDNYSPTKLPTEEVTMAVPPHETSYSAPQAPSFAVKYWLTAPRQTSNAVVAGHFSSPRMVRGIEIVDKGVSNPESNHVENLTQTQRKAEPIVMRMTQEVKAQSQTQPVDQKGPTQYVPQAQSQPTALLQESSHLQESPEKKATRKLQKLEDISMIADNKGMQEILHDQSQLDTFLQDFTPPQQEIAWETWMVEKDKVDTQYSELLNIPEVVGDNPPSGLQADSGITNQLGGYEKNEFDTDIDSDDKVKSHDDELTYPSFSSRVLHPRPVHPVHPVRRVRSSSPVRTYTSKELLHFVWQKHDAKLLVNLLRDQKRLDVYLEKFPMQQKKVAQDTWSNELRIALQFLQRTLEKIGISVINEGEEDKVKARANEQEHLDHIESEVNKRLQKKFLSRLRAEQDKEAEKGKAHRQRIEMQLQFINTGEFSTQIEFSDGEIEIKKKRKRGTYYAGSPDMPPTPAEKRNSGEEKLEVEGKALKKRIMAQPNRLVIPDSFNHSYLKIFPKEPKETTLQFRERKRAAYLRSLEIQDVEAHRQPMSSTIEHGEQQIAGEFLAKLHEVGTEFKSNAGGDGEQEVKTNKAIVSPLEVGNQIKSSAFDDGYLPDYESDMDINFR